jgi:DNA mismatch endonuclease (patch repair protein)
VSSIRKRAPSASSLTARKVMRANVGHETAPEKALRTAAGEAGLEFETDTRPEKDLRWTADLVFREARICVFVDGCYWHGCPEHFKLPKTNSAWWEEKIQANRDRDQKQVDVLTERGWVVMRFWEHDVLGDSTEAVDRIRAACERC